MSNHKPTDPHSGPYRQNSSPPAVSIHLGPLHVQLDRIPHPSLPRWLTTAVGWLTAGGLGWSWHWR